MLVEEEFHFKNNHCTRMSIDKEKQIKLFFLYATFRNMNFPSKEKFLVEIFGMREKGKSNFTYGYIDLPFSFPIIMNKELYVMFKEKFDKEMNHMGPKKRKKLEEIKCDVIDFFIESVNKMNWLYEIGL